MSFNKHFISFLVCFVIICSCNDLALFEKEEALLSIFENIRESKNYQPEDTVTLLTLNIQLGFPNGKDPWNDNDGFYYGGNGYSGGE